VLFFDKTDDKAAEKFGQKLASLCPSLELVMNDIELGDLYM
jgi:hypothetical protein